MPRCEAIEAILRAQFELECSEPQDLPERLSNLNLLLDRAIVDTFLTRRELLSALRDRYKEFKRAQLRAEAQRRSV